MSEEITFKLSGPQHDVLYSKSSHRAFIGGIGSGKTFIGCLSILFHSLNNPGAHCLVVSQKHEILRNVNIKTFLSICPEEYVIDYNRSNLEITLFNNSKLFFRSAKDKATVENLRGAEYSFAHIDECCILPDNTYPVIAGRMRQKGYPLVLLMTSSPKMGSWYTLLHENKNVHLIDNIPTRSNKHLPEEYVNQLEEIYTGQFYNQELMGQWVQLEGIIWEIKKVFEYPKGPLTFFYGCDWGWTDPSVVVVGAKDKWGNITIVDEFYETHADDDRMVKEILSFYEKYGRGPVYADPSRPDSINKLKKNNINVKPANNKRLDGFRTVRTEFDRGRLFVLDSCIETISEGVQFCYDGDSDEKTVGLDHAMDSLRYLIMGAVSNGKRAANFKLY